jgi:guanylate cyclase soluble subunit beta
MYGIINSAMQDMIVDKFGAAQWEEIHAHSKVPEDAFLSMRSYDDAITYQLVTSASEVLEAPVDACLEMFGLYWVEEIAAKSFAPLMDTTGTHTIDFLNNLNALHDRISSTFTDYVPPEFQVEAPEPGQPENHFRVHYFSKRDGLTAFVVGLLKGLADHFGDQLEIVGVDIQPQDPTGTHSIFDLVVDRGSA